ncbi:hypothetical protein ATK36_2054 [Amycolatopsis sulphurea]|uniref:Uncharacterized protein n=1 Tax=Amycolatopsis sulphurea TaxID=76022 RepID=A0A2A9F9E7_9PSEU|nr:hypothetical protein ATK36_2054 [Amycolatopsis sulphurea]
MVVRDRRLLAPAGGAGRVVVLPCADCWMIPAVGRDHPTVTMLPVRLAVSLRRCGADGPGSSPRCRVHGGVRPDSTSGVVLLCQAITVLPGCVRISVMGSAAECGDRPGRPTNPPRGPTCPRRPRPRPAWSPSDGPVRQGWSRRCWPRPVRLYGRVDLGAAGPRPRTTGRGAAPVGLSAQLTPWRSPRDQLGDHGIGLGVDLLAGCLPTADLDLSGLGLLGDRDP